MHSQPQVPQPDPRVSPNYETILNAAPEDALTLGVDGHDARANARRAQIAARLDVEFQRREGRTWADAREPQAPDLPMPFGAGLVADAAGDLRHVLDTHEPELIRQVLHRRGKYRQYVDVEGDGSIRHRVPSTEERRAAEQEVARVRAVLAERGALNPVHGADDGPAAGSHWPRPGLPHDEKPAQMNYQAVMKAAPADALMLGIDGHSAEANARRTQIATDIAAEFQRREDRAYARAPWNQEPDLIQPFGARLVTAAAGDLRHVLDAHASDLVYQLQHRQGRYADYYVSDEDGVRIERSYPADDDERAAEQEIATIRRILAERGALGPERDSAESAAVATQPACRAYHPPGTGPNQSPGSVNNGPWTYPQYEHAEEAHADAEIDPPF